MDISTLNQRLAYLRFTDAQRVALKELWPVIEPSMPGVLDKFYAHVTSLPHLANLFGGKPVAHARNGQLQHWRLAMQDGLNEGYLRRSETIGSIHFRVGLEPQWYIGAYLLIMQELTPVIVKAYRWKPEKIALAIQSLNALAFLDMELALDTYQRMVTEDRLKKSADVIGTQFENQLASQIDTIAAATQELDSTASSITAKMSENLNLAQQAKAKADATESMNQKLISAANEITSVTDLITEIAEQTNLLALNAAIEAARAGDNGRGFAVVANEVKKLASQTADATKGIGSKVADIRGASQKVLEANREVVSSMDRIVGSFADVDHSIQEQRQATGDIGHSLHDTQNALRTLISHIRSGQM